MTLHFHRFALATLCAMPLLLGACAVGPDFEAPASPDVQRYTETSLPEKTAAAKTVGGEAQRFVAGQDISAEWWKLFHSKPLNNLVAKALETNPDLQAAKAALRQAEENYKAGQGAFFPSVDAGIGATGRKMTGASGGSDAELPSFTLYNASVDVGYPIDIFGGVRRNVERLEALKESQRFEMEAAKLALTANVVTAAIQEASLRAQIEATKRILADEGKQLGLLRQQLELGAIDKTSVLAQETEIAQTRTSLPVLEKQLAQTRHQLAVLAGQFPGQKLEESFTLDSLKLPVHLPLSLPSQLVAQRPDIQAATAQMHAASAAVGIATANMLPQLTLTGSYGFDAIKLASLFTPQSAIWSIGSSLLQPLFRGGELLHEKRASEAGFDRAAAQYRSVVLTAFQNVADSLRALEADAEALKAQAAAEGAAAASLRLSREQYKAGAIGYPSLLSAEQAYQRARIALVQARAHRYADTAALFTALGGGWWNQKTDDGKQMTEKAEPQPAATETKPASRDWAKKADQQE